MQNICLEPAMKNGMCMFIGVFEVRESKYFSRILMSAMVMEIFKEY
jgi:hypothetical protein